MLVLAFDMSDWNSLSNGNAGAARPTQMLRLTGTRKSGYSISMNINSKSHFIAAASTPAVKKAEKLQTELIVYIIYIKVYII